MNDHSQPLGTTQLIGRRKSDLETPCLCLNLDQFDQNVTQIAGTVKRARKNWRPHGKCHKSPEIARQTIDHGAIGVTCAKVSEAEVFAADQIREILIAHLPVGARRIERLAALCRTADPIVTCDHYVQAESLSAECLRQSVTCRILVDINIGLDRTGVRPGRDALELASGIERLPGLKLAGIMGYEGHVVAVSDAEEKRKSIDAALGILVQSRHLFLKNGHCCDIVSAGGSGSFPQALRCEAVTEFQAGSAIFGDPYFTRQPDVEGFAPALTILATVVSRPAYDRAVLDAGKKAVAAGQHPPVVKDWDDANIVMHSAEHIVLRLGPASRELRIGDQVELIVGHSDLTTMLHDEYVCCREDRIEAVWPIPARGKLV